MSAPAPKPRGVEQDLKDIEQRMFMFEAQLQAGEFDLEDPHATERHLIERERALKILKYRGDVQQMAARADGRRVLWRILELCGPNRISYVAGDTHATAVNEGKRMIANEVLLMLFDADPSVYSQMQREHLSDLKAEQERKKKESTEAQQI